MVKKFAPFFLFGILIFFQSCEVQIANDRRILVKGNIVDGAGNPLSDISVRSTTKGEILGETAGHRYISSTERYLQDDLENLHETINNFHPIS